MTELTITPSAEFEARLAEATAFLTRGLDSGRNMLSSAANPAAEIAAAGYDIPEESWDEFNTMFALTTGPELLSARAAIEQGLDTWPSFKCSGCTIICWAVGLAIVGVGAAVVATLGPEAGVVTSLASLVGCSAEAALAFLQAVIPKIAAGVAAVVAAICIWTHACTEADFK